MRVFISHTDYSLPPDKQSKVEARYLYEIEAENDVMPRCELQRNMMIVETGRLEISFDQETARKLARAILVAIAEREAKLSGRAA